MAVDAHRPEVIGIAVRNQQAVERPQPAGPECRRHDTGTDVDGLSERDASGVNQHRRAGRQVERVELLLHGLGQGTEVVRVRSGRQGDRTGAVDLGHRTRRQILMHFGDVGDLDRPGPDVGDVGLFLRQIGLLVAELDGGVAGFATSSVFRERAAYSRSVETSVYCDPSATGRGLGTALYTGLFALLATEELHRAYAGIALPNDASEALHRRFGFREVGTYTEVGHKLDQWWDVRWYERPLP